MEILELKYKKKYVAMFSSFRLLSLHSSSGSSLTYLKLVLDGGILSFCEITLKIVTVVLIWVKFQFWTKLSL